MIFNNDRKQSQGQNTGQKDVQNTFHGKELSDAQRDSLREGKTVYTGELLDKKGQKYVGYVTLNKETGKLDFMFPRDYKEALANGKVVPGDWHSEKQAEKQAEKQEQGKPKKIQRHKDVIMRIKS